MFSSKCFLLSYRKSTLYFGEAATQSAVSLSRSERKKHKALNSFSVEILLLMIFSSFKKKCDFIFSLSSFFFFQIFFSIFFLRALQKMRYKRERERKKREASVVARSASTHVADFFFSLSRARARRSGSGSCDAPRRDEARPRRWPSSTSNGSSSPTTRRRACIRSRGKCQGHSPPTRWTRIE